MVAAKGTLEGPPLSHLFPVPPLLLLCCLPKWAPELTMQRHGPWEYPALAQSQAPQSKAVTDPTGAPEILAMPICSHFHSHLSER